MADVVLVIHFAFVLFIVGGFVLIWIGYFLKWSWIRNFRFRIAHLIAMAFVAVETILGITCPLTEFESRLRNTDYEKGFIAHWIHEWMFYSAPDHVFVAIYVVFFILIAATYRIVRPTRLK